MFLKRYPRGSLPHSIKVALAVMLAFSDFIPYQGHPRKRGHFHLRLPNTDHKTASMVEVVCLLQNRTWAEAEPWVSHHQGRHSHCGGCVCLGEDGQSAKAGGGGKDIKSLGKDIHSWSIKPRQHTVESNHCRFPVTGATGHAATSAPSPQLLPFPWSQSCCPTHIQNSCQGPCLHDNPSAVCSASAKWLALTSDPAAQLALGKFDLVSLEAKQQCPERYSLYRRGM